MDSFLNIKELLLALYREEKLLAELFKKRKESNYKYDYALELVDGHSGRIQYLISHEVLRQNEQILELSDLYLQFFEQVLQANEEINIGYINENLEKIRQNILYYFNETNEQRKYEYLRTIKNTFRKIGPITLRNLIDLKRNIDHTFKNEPNYKNKRAKLTHLDNKRKDIVQLIAQTLKLIGEEELTFFKTATDEELHRITIELKLILGKCSHNLIEIERQIIDFLNRIEQQSDLIEKIRKLKYLKDQFILETKSNIREVLSKTDPVLFEPRPAYSIRLSLGYLQTDSMALDALKKISGEMKSGVKNKRPVAENISQEYLETKTREEIQINLEEVKNSFLAKGYDLFDFLLQYRFPREVSFDELITIYCQLVSEYEALFNITNKSAVKNEIEFALIYPK